MRVKEDKGISCTILSIVYVVLAYISPLVGLRLIGSDAEKISSMAFCALVLPFLAGIVNAVYIRINRQKISRVTLLRCAIIIKYLMIPMYIIGGLLIAVFILLTCTPVVIMIFVGPFMIAVLSAYGYLTMLGGNAFSVAYIRKAREEGVHGRIVSTAGMIFQFFFSLDVISIAVLSLKERKYIPATIAVIAILLMGMIGITVWLVLKMTGVL